MATLATMEIIGLEVIIINPEEEIIETGSNLEDILVGEAAIIVATLKLSLGKKIESEQTRE